MYRNLKLYLLNFVILFLFQVAHLEEELTVKNQAFKYLEEKIKSQQDYEEIKRELKYAIRYFLKNNLKTEI